MTLPSFRLGIGKCIVEFCINQGGHLGYCKEHYEHAILRRHARLRAAGANAPTPACFPSDSDWREYEVLSANARFGSRARKQPLGANPCLDCTPEYQARMLAAGKCAHPETVFIKRRDSGVEGVNKQSRGQWVLAVTGALGPVVKRPDSATSVNTMKGME